MQINRFEAATPLHVLVLTSPKAGSGSGRDEIPRLEGQLAKQGIPCEIIDSIDRMRARLQEGQPSAQTVLIAAGGDGTLSLAASLMMEAEQNQTNPQRQSKTLLLPMPLGTENLVAREYGHSHDAEEVMATLRSGVVQEMDMGLCDERVFLIMASAGFDAEVVRWLHLTRRGHISRITYLRPILRSFFSFQFPPIHVSVDGQSQGVCAWAMAFNLPQYGGDLRIEPNADGSDGELDVILFRKAGIWSGLKYVWKIARGKHLDDPTVTRLRGRQVSFESDQRVPLQIDGDCQGELPTHLQVLPKAFSLVLPASAA